MSWWTHIRGTVEVTPMGCTQPECDYILNTVLEHLPVVTGSEGDMVVHVTRRDGHNSSSSCDEFGNITNNLKTQYGNYSRRGSYYMQDEYILTIEADLRDRMFAQTKKEFLKWLIRLGKRVWVRDVLVRVWGYGDERMVIDNAEGFSNLRENASWFKTNEQPRESNWTEYLMWERDPKSWWPMKLVHKYYNDPDIDTEIERRENWERNLDPRRKK